MNRHCQDLRGSGGRLKAAEKFWKENGMKFFIALFFVLLASTPAFAGDKESAYDRVMRTGTIRCGYWVFPPLLIRDANTNKMSGAYVDYVEALGKALDLKIEWTTEINLGTYLQDLNQGKFDAECGTGWPNALRGKQVEYATPVGYLPMYLYAKADNTAFDRQLEKANQPDVRFAGHDGGTNTLGHDRFFPKSTLISIPGDSPFTEPLDMIRYGKADITMMASIEAQEYMAHNPKSVRRVISDPLRVIPLCLTVPAGEFRFINMINTATQELLYDGTINFLYKKYDIPSDIVLRVANPYRE